MTISQADAAHLLRRSGFAATPSRITVLAGSRDWAHAVDQVLDTSQNPAVVMPPSMATNQDNSWPQWVDMVQWWMRRMRTSPCPIVEKMTLFWHNHLPSSFGVNNDAPLLWRQHNTYRTHALGNYHDLIQAMAVDPWMLHYLDNGSNRHPRAVNENFGREVMELFTLGVGQYSEADVVAMSRAWTGHNLNAARNGYTFNASAHDASNKTLFGITAPWDGPAALAEILEGSKAEASSKFLAAKLWSYLAAPNPEPALVADLAKVFRDSNLSILALVRGVFMRPEFRLAATRTALVRSPVEWFVALTAALGIDEKDSHPEWWLKSMGQHLFHPPNVSGWKLNSWLSSATWWARGDCVSHIRWVAVDADRGYNRLSDLRSNATPAQVTAAIFPMFGITDPSPGTRAVIENWTRAVSGTGDGWSLRPNAITLAALSPDFCLG